MTKEKIKELLLSKDKELRLLGLSYLNEDKTSSDLCITSTQNWLYAYTSHYIVSLSTDEKGRTTPFKSIYDFIINLNYFDHEEFIIDTFSKMLTPYINYCYK